MTYKTVSVTVDVDVVDVVHYIDDEELVKELTRRGFTVVKEIAEDFEREDYDYLIEMLDKMSYSWYTNRIRDKLFTARHKESS